MIRKKALNEIKAYVVKMFEDGGEIKVGSNIEGFLKLIPDYLTAMFNAGELLKHIPQIMVDAIEELNSKGKKVIRVRLLDESTGQFITLLALEETIVKELEIVKQSHGDIPSNVVIVNNLEGGFRNV